MIEEFKKNKENTSETWQELKVKVKREGGVGLNLLIELGAQGVAIEDSMDYVGMSTFLGEFSQRSGAT